MKNTPKNPTHATDALEDPRWAALAARDSQADGKFVYAVRTTGVYCRPSCPSRLPRPENVSFFESSAQAEADGYRPCKRCQPDQAALSEQHAALVAESCRLIESSERQLDLAELAEHAGMSKYHFHRVFKLVTGLTPRQYGAAQREQRLRQEIVQTGSITEAIYSAGYGSNSRFYASASQALGMTPTRYRRGGMETTIRFAIGECSLGAILVAQSEQGLCAIMLGDDPEELARLLQDRFPQAELVGGDREFEQTVAQVIGFVEAPRIGLDLPLDVRGSAFQQRVWRALQQIPAGQTASYSDVASRIGAPKATRAVAQACAANPLAVAIPCHRVVRTDGSLSGYRWGVERKRLLLEREASQVRQP